MATAKLIYARKPDQSQEIGMRRADLLSGLIPIFMVGIPAPLQADNVDPCYLQQTTLEINSCLTRTYETADRTMNLYYQKLVKNLTAAHANDPTNYQMVSQQLAIAQRYWLSYRENDCKAKLTLFAAGSIRAAIYLGCLVDRTEQRSRELRAWLQEEGTSATSGKLSRQVFQ